MTPYAEEIEPAPAGSLRDDLPEIILEARRS